MIAISGGSWPGSRSKRAGLALFELVVVLVVLALVGAMAIPRVTNSIRRQRLDCASRRLMADLRLACSQAIRDQADRKLVLSAATHSYTLPHHIVGGAAYQVELNASPYQGVTLRSVSYDPPEVIFSRLGIPQAGGSIILGDGVEQAVITVSATTGRATCVLQPAS